MAFVLNTKLPSMIRIATRSSELAMWQARHVADLIQQHFPEIVTELVDVTTQGDVDQIQPLRAFGGTGLFTKEVQKAVLERRADIAVHSLKDLPTEILEPDLMLAAVPEREIRWDALVLPAGQKINSGLTNPFEFLAENSRVGTGSLRRQAQLKAERPDLQLLEIRGNLNTRLQKLDIGEYDVLILAAAGLLRLGWQHRLSTLLQPPWMFPAVSQGALGLECRADDELTQTVLSPLNHPPARLATTAERALLAALRAGCHAPVGVNTVICSGQATLTAVVLTTDGQKKLQVQKSCPIDEAVVWNTQLDVMVKLGQSVADEMRELGVEKLMNHLLK